MIGGFDFHSTILSSNYDDDDDDDSLSVDGNNFSVEIRTTLGCLASVL
jgi:hypothetical protein